MTIKELKRNILLSLYNRYKDDKSTNIGLKDLCAQENLIFDSPKQVADAAKGLKEDGYIKLTMYIGGDGLITGLTPSGIEYVEENLLTKEDLVSDGLADTAKMVQSGMKINVDLPDTERDEGNNQSPKSSKKSVTLFKTRENFKDIVDANVTPCFGIKAVTDCFAKQLDKIATSKTESTRMLGIFGPWGRGKTYFFKQLKADLEDKQRHTLKYKIVEFNAWKYQDTPALWAYLYETIYKSSSWLEKTINFIRQTIQINDVIIYFLILVVGWLIGWFVSEHSNNVIREFLVSIKIPASAIYLFSGIAYTLVEKPVTVRRIIKRYTSRKSYKNYLGIQNEIEENLQKLLQSMVLCPSKSRVILYVDDIDRCPSRKMVSLIEALRTVLENPKIQERLIVICSIDEKKLLQSYKQELIANGFNQEQSNQLSREQLDKLFLFGIKLADLDSTQLQEYLETLIENSNSENKTNTPNEQKEEIPFSTARQKGAFISTNASEEIPELNDERIESLFKDYFVSHRNLRTITPRKIRIMYYQVLFALSLSSKRGNGEGAFTDQLVEIMLNKYMEMEYDEDIEKAMSDIIEMAVPY